MEDLQVAMRTTYIGQHTRAVDFRPRDDAHLTSSHAPVRTRQNIDIFLSGNTFVVSTNCLQQETSQARVRGSVRFRQFQLMISARWGRLPVVAVLLTYPCVSAHHVRSAGTHIIATSAAA